MAKEIQHRLDVDSFKEHSVKERPREWNDHMWVETQPICRVDGSKWSMQSILPLESDSSVSVDLELNR